jgi:hypothetical protein|tara:strand:- start:60 stop:215 length:156 start_codon:yes stop_codon:yes gene_type:complete
MGTNGKHRKKAPKGYHFMPDGSLMKDSDMKKGVRANYPAAKSGKRKTRGKY